MCVVGRLAEKELQRKSLEDSLNAERSSGASRETSLQVSHVSFTPSCIAEVCKLWPTTKSRLLGLPVQKETVLLHTE